MQTVARNWVNFYYTLNVPAILQVHPTALPKDPLCCEVQTWHLQPVPWELTSSGAFGFHGCIKHTNSSDHLPAGHVAGEIRGSVSMTWSWSSSTGRPGGRWRPLSEHSCRCPELPQPTDREGLSYQNWSYFSAAVRPAIGELPERGAHRRHSSQWPGWKRPESCTFLKRRSSTVTEWEGELLVDEYSSTSSVGPRQQ